MTSRQLQVVDRLINKAIARGAFSGTEFLTMHAIMDSDDDAGGKQFDSDAHKAFYRVDECRHWLRTQYPDLDDDEERPRWQSYTIIARALRAEADKMVPSVEGEAKEHTHISDETAALVVNVGTLRISYKGHTCNFKASRTFDLMSKLAKHSGVPILGDRAVVSRLRQQLRKDKVFAPITKAIVSKGDSLYALDSDAIGGVKLVEAQISG